MEFLFEALMPTTLFVAMGTVVSFDLIIVFWRSELSLQDSFQAVTCSSTTITSIAVPEERNRVSENEQALAAQDRNMMTCFFSSFLSLLLHSLIIGLLSVVNVEFAKFSFDNSRDTSRASCKHSMMRSMSFLVVIAGVFFLEGLHSPKI
jgi:hypothetical protein